MIKKYYNIIFNYTWLGYILSQFHLDLKHLNLDVYSNFLIQTFFEQLFYFYYVDHTLNG